VAVIERQRCIGGVCIETGTIPSKTFREAVIRCIGQPDNEGELRIRTRPTMEHLLSQVQRSIVRESNVVEDALSRNDIEVFRGQAKIIDAHTIEIELLEGHVRMQTANILVAVGTRPSDPPGLLADGQTIMTSDGLLSMRTLPRTMTVVGAGVIGIEYASMFAMLGVQVTIIDRRPRPLEFLDHEIVDELIHQMRRRNVIFRLNASRSSMADSARAWSFSNLASIVQLRSCCSPQAGLGRPADWAWKRFH
jgi:NAD(P) transhydrogenase